MSTGTRWPPLQELKVADLVTPRIVYQIGVPPRDLADLEILGESG